MVPRAVGSDGLVILKPSAQAALEASLQSDSLGHIVSLIGSAVLSRQTGSRACHWTRMSG